MKKKTNRLAKESSPYLRQHAHNPVDWFPWGDEALRKAIREDKPIFLSIGYSACHWCHVMEKESFEDASTAKLMNESFVNIKVDREERPDLDHIYMTSVQLMTQHGGWPMSVFLTPELRPFYGGTYFPPTDRHGMPSFKKILQGVATAWKTRKQEIQESAAKLTEAIQQIQIQTGKSEEKLSMRLPEGALEKILSNVDWKNGGFGNHPKFFHASDLKVCLRQWKHQKKQQALDAVQLTLDKISAGGIFDHLGGGFHRYSTDSKWLVPHFEKMLYDNALLVDLFLEAFQVTRNPNYAQIIHQTLDYVLREMTSEEGGFFSTQDADSEGVEGKFYVWKKPEILGVLGNDLGETFCEIYGVSEHGNWEGVNILHTPQSLETFAKKKQLELDWLLNELSIAKRKLLAVRAERIAPFRDEKFLTSWNGLMIHAFAFAHQVFEEERYQAAAVKGGEFIWNSMRRIDTKNLLHTLKPGHEPVAGFLDDYANTINAFVTVYESTFDETWLTRATHLATEMVEKFWDRKAGIFFFTPVSEKDTLIARPQEIHDGALPSAGGMAVTALVRLARITSQPQFSEAAEKALEHAIENMKNLPTASAQLLIALEDLINDPKEMVLVPGKDTDDNHAALAEVRRTFLPQKSLLYKEKDQGRLPLFQGRIAVGDEVSLYVCRNSTCQAPIVGKEAIAGWLADV